jgi:hypothetical protein
VQYDEKSSTQLWYFVLDAKHSMVGVCVPVFLFLFDDKPTCWKKRATERVAILKKRTMGRPPPLKGMFFLGNVARNVNKSRILVSVMVLLG